MKVHHLQDPRSPEISEQEPQAKRSESEPSQGQKRPILPGGESKSSKESRAGSAQASQGVKRRAEDEGDEERIRDIPDVEGDLSALILDHREMFLESIEDQDELFVRRRLLYHLNCKTKQLRGGTMTLSVEKCWTAKESSKLEEMRSRSLKP